MLRQTQLRQSPQRPLPPILCHLREHLLRRIRRSLLPGETSHNTTGSLQACRFPRAGPAKNPMRRHPQSTSTLWQQHVGHAPVRRMSSRDRRVRYVPTAWRHVRRTQMGSQRLQHSRMRPSTVHAAHDASRLYHLEAGTWYAFCPDCCRRRPHCTSCGVLGRDHLSWGTVSQPPNTPPVRRCGRAG